MNRLAALTIGQKVSLALGLLLIVVLSGAAVASYVSQRASAAVDESAQSLEEVTAVSAALRAWAKAAATLDYLLLTRQASLVPQDLVADRAAFTSTTGQMQSVLGKGATGAAQLTELTGLASRLNALSEQVAALAEEEQWVAAQLLRYGELASTEEQFQQRLMVLADGSGAAAATAAAEARDLQSHVRGVAIASALVVTVLAIAGAYLLTGSIIGPIRALTSGTENFAQGNFDVPLPQQGDDEVGRLATALNNTALALQKQYGGLERQMDERARALETSIEVGRQLATIHEVDELVAAVVEQVRQAFGYYHVHIYLLDQARERLLLAGGTGEAGRTMMANGHRLEIGQGLVGRSAQRNEVVLAPDTRSNPDWLPNQLLPETSAEIAVPIAYGGEVLGVLDVQHDEYAGLGEDDAVLLQAIAGQVAVALQNARLLQEAEERGRQAALATLIGQRIQRANSVEEVLQLAVQELGLALGSDRARVQLRAAPYMPVTYGQAPAQKPLPEEVANR